jgi:hypothetical protein
MIFIFLHGIHTIGMNSNFHTRKKSCAKPEEVLKKPEQNTIFPLNIYSI